MSLTSVVARQLYWCAIILLGICVAYVLCNLRLAVSFLNHWRFSHANLSDYSFSSTFVVLLSALDASALNLIAQDDVTVLYVKRDAFYYSLIIQVLPALVLQTVFLLLGVDLGALDAQSSLPVATIVGFSFSLTLIACVWKLMLLIVILSLHTCPLTPSRARAHLA